MLNFLRDWLLIAWVTSGLVAMELTSLAIAGYQYVPKSAIESVWLHDYSSTRDGSRTATILRQRKRDSYDSISNEVEVTVDGSQHSMRLPANISAHRIGISTQGTLAISTPSGNILVMRDSDYPMEISDLQLLSSTEDNCIRALRFTEDGRFLAASSPGGCYLWDLDPWNSGEIMHSEIRHADAGQFLSFSNDSQHYIECSAEGTIRVRDVMSGAIARETSMIGCEFTAAAWSPCSNLVVLETTDFEIFMWSLTANRILWKRSGRLRSKDASAFTSDGKLVAILDTRGVQINVCCADRGYRLASLDLNARVRGLRFEQDSKIFYWDEQGNDACWDVGNATSKLGQVAAVETSDSFGR